jgi:hypothetical protein
MLESPTNTAPEVLVRAGNWRERRHALTGQRRARLGVRVSRRSPTIIRYFGTVAGNFPQRRRVHRSHAPRAAHHRSRVLGFTQELFDDSNTFDQGPEVIALVAHQMAAEYPNLSEMMLQISHDETTVVGSGCDDKFEFEFALDLLLDGIERLHQAAL